MYRWTDSQFRDRPVARRASDSHLIEPARLKARSGLLKGQLRNIRACSGRHGLAQPQGLVAKGLGEGEGKLSAPRRAALISINPCPSKHCAAGIRALRVVRATRHRLGKSM
jgi:hypothetical protein